jgi:hypothetical protein
MRFKAFTLVEILLSLLLFGLISLLISSLLKNTFSLYLLGVEQNKLTAQILKIEGMLDNTFAYSVQGSQREHHVGQEHYLIFMPYEEKLVFHQDSFDEAREILTLTSSDPSFQEGYTFFSPYPSLSSGQLFFISNLEQLSTLYQTPSLSKKIISAKSSSQIELLTGYDDVFSNRSWHQGYVVYAPYALSCNLVDKTLMLWTDLSSYSSLSTSSELPDLTGATSSLIAENIEQCDLSLGSITLSLREGEVKSPVLIKTIG